MRARYPFGFWYGRLRFLRTAKSRRWLLPLKRSRWWRLEWKITEALNYFAGYDTRWRGYGKKAIARLEQNKKQAYNATESDWKITKGA